MRTSPRRKPESEKSMDITFCFNPYTFEVDEVGIEPPLELSPNIGFLTPADGCFFVGGGECGWVIYIIFLIIFMCFCFQFIWPTSCFGIPFTIHSQYTCSFMIHFSLPSKFTRV